MSGGAPRILLVGEEHVREKVARHYDQLGELRGFETHYYVDDRSGITHRLQESRALHAHYGPDPSRGVWALLRYWVAFLRCFEAVRPQVLEVYTGINFMAVLPMVLYAAVRGVPRVVVCRGELYPPVYRRYSAPARQALKWILRLANLVVYKELYMDARLAELCPRTPRLCWTNAIPVRGEPRYERSGNVVLFLNFFKEWRNLDVVVKAAPAVRQAVPDVRFELVGGTDQLAAASPFYAGLHEYEQKIRALADTLGVGDVVRIHPFTDRVEPFYSRAKLYLLPADLVFCNYALLEAMERGVPPIVSDERDPDARRIVEDGVSGVVAPIDPDALARAIVALLGDEEARQRLGRGARARVVERFNLDTQLRQLADHYEALAGVHGVPAAVPAAGGPVGGD